MKRTHQQRLTKFEIPNRKKFKRRDSWTEAEIALLGTRPDDEIALALGRTAAAVRTRRQILGIKGPWSPRAWTKEEEALLGTMPDKGLARRLARGLSAVRVRRNMLGRPARNPRRHKLWTPKEDRLLGTAFDSNIARRLNRTYEAVKTRRKEKGIRGWGARQLES